jgi:hypothetical protein
MGDAGEVLVDAEDRYQDRLAELERKATADKQIVIDGVRERARKSLELARAELSRQLEGTTHPARRGGIESAIAEVDRRLAKLLA